MKKIIHQLSIKSRLILMLILVSLISSIVIGVLSWRIGYVSLNATIFNQLTSIRSSKAFEIETYFDQIFKHTRTLAEDRMIVSAMKQFNEGYEVGLYRSLTPEQEQELMGFYDDTFVPRLAKAFNEPPLSIVYRPKRAVTSFFQYHYVAANPYPITKKDQLVEAEGDNTIYARFHKFYHPLLRNLVQQYGYYDAFLIDIKSLSIVYSVSKEIDFATSLRDGPHSESGIGALANQIRERPERSLVSVVDYQTYIPSYGEPSAFVGSPIFDGNEAIGILVFQLPTEKINRVMTNDRNWESHGLGQTGESYLVGPDRMMRSNSRLYSEDKNAFYMKLKEIGASEITSRSIQNFSTTILTQPAIGKSVNAAFDGHDGTQKSFNYLGNPILSSYAPLKIPSLDWIILTEISQKEAFEPITRLQRNILIWSVVLVLGVAFLALLLAQYFIRPIQSLSQGFRSLEAGDEATHVDGESNDEFGEIVRNFNTMAARIRNQTATIKEKEDENERLLLNVLPKPIVDRMREGEKIADQLQQVSIIYIEIQGFTELSTQIDVEQSAEYLDRLTDIIDDIAEKNEIERVKILGNTYVGGCGLTTTRLDHAKRAVDFAIAVLKGCHRFNTENNTTLAPQIGIDSGAINTGVIGDENFSFEIWGTTLELACRIHYEAKPNTVLISENSHERVSSFFKFERSTLIDLQNHELQLYQIGLDDIVLDASAKEIAS